jgi:hypothetical protein
MFCVTSTCFPPRSMTFLVSPPKFQPRNTPREWIQPNMKPESKPFYICHAGRQSAYPSLQQPKTASFETYISFEKRQRPVLLASEIDLWASCTHCEKERIRFHDNETHSGTLKEKFWWRTVTICRAPIVGNRSLISITKGAIVSNVEFLWREFWRPSFFLARWTDLQLVYYPGIVE